MDNRISFALLHLFVEVAMVLTSTSDIGAEFLIHAIEWSPVKRKFKQRFSVGQLTLADKVEPIHVTGIGKHGTSIVMAFIHTQTISQQVDFLYVIGEEGL